ncbi:hypothetical protein [Eubacterium sp.]|uniref:hypothetical protein n=1 Tax=Eubacterium sp. TaxID=142586 RepID=UPI0026E00695|nr:hypothetical protein [Eubacterium sp.]MDO5433340.1 hypothetical protein [Eubacterium sp.]
MKYKKSKFLVSNAENKVIFAGTIEEIAKYLKITVNKVRYALKRQDDPFYLKNYGYRITQDIGNTVETNAESYAKYVKDNLENEKADFTVIPCKTGGIDVLAIKVKRRQEGNGPMSKKSIKTMAIVPPFDKWEYSLLVLAAKINRDMGCHCV